MNRLLEYRKSQGLTQEAMAKKMGVAFSTYRQWEKEMVRPNRDNEEKINAFFIENGVE